MKESILLFMLLAQFLDVCSQRNTFVDDRDSNQYSIVTIGQFEWFQENLRFQFSNGNDTLISESNCGVFYKIDEAFKACPAGWRLPNHKEVKELIKQDLKGNIDLTDTLQIVLCGRIDYEDYGKAGEQNTFWIDAKLEDGQIVHWHTFGNSQEIHSHNVVNARRKFPIRCLRASSRKPFNQEP